MASVHVMPLKASFFIGSPGPPSVDLYIRQQTLITNLIPNKQIPPYPDSCMSRERDRSRSPPGRPVSSRFALQAGSSSCDRNELLGQLVEAVTAITSEASTVSVEVLQEVVPLVLAAASLVQNAVRADRLAILRAAGDSSEGEEGVGEGWEVPTSPACSVHGASPVPSRVGSPVSVAPSIPSLESVDVDGGLADQPEESEEELLQHGA